MSEDADTLDNLRRAVLHQAVIRRDIGLALGGVNDQRFNFISATAQFTAGGEACAAEASNAKLVDTLDQRFTRAGLIVAPAIALDPAVSPSASMITLISASADGCAVVCGAMAAMVPEVGA